MILLNMFPGFTDISGVKYLSRSVFVVMITFTALHIGNLVNNAWMADL